MKEKLIPAPVDEKNVTTDWLADIFDNGCCVGCETRNFALGFVNDCPIAMQWYDNTIIWRIIANNINNYDAALDVLFERLCQAEGCDGNVFSKIVCHSSYITQIFFFKEDK